MFGFLSYYLNGYVLISGILILLFLLVFLRRQRRSWIYLGFFSAFWLYLVLLVSAAIFSGIYIRAETWQERIAAAPWVLSRVNLVPFGSYHTLNAFSWVEMLMNVLMTIPLGFLVNFLARIRFPRMLGFSLLTGLGFELGQLVLTLYAGSPTRAIDITDVILNGLGTLLGYGLFRLFAWLYGNIIERWHLQPKGLFAFLYEASRHSRMAG